MIESSLIALVVFILGAVISFLVASLIKTIFFGIKLNENLRAKNNVSWQGNTLTSKPAGH